MKETIDTKKLLLIMKLTNIFEKEVIMFSYYSLFSLITIGAEAINFQFLFFAVGTFVQIHMKMKNIYKNWNNFIILLFFSVGSLVNYNDNFFLTGFLTFIFIVTIVSFLYDMWSNKLKNKLLYLMSNIFYSAIVLFSFPILYFSFMKNKLGIDLIQFFTNKEHLLVFSGYFTVYLLLLVNKQLLVMQTVLFKSMHKNR